MVPTKTLVDGVRIKTTITVRKIKPASILLPRIARLTTRRLSVPGRKSSPPNRNGFQGAKEAIIVPMKTAKIPSVGSNRTPRIGVTIPLAVRKPGRPRNLDTGISRKTVYTAASEAVRASFLVVKCECCKL